MKEKTSIINEEKTTDMKVEEFRKYGYELIDFISDYIADIEKYPVLSQVKPGDIKNKLPKSPPKKSESMDDILKDIKDIIMPGLTHWNHPSYFAYFPSTASFPGILGELLTAAFNQNGFLWRTSPALTELEEVTLSWLRQMISLKEDFFGIIYDTASTGTMHAFVSAREALNLKIKEEGMAGRKDLFPLRLYTSKEAHSSVDKAAVVIGIGQNSIRKIEIDGAYQMKVDALEDAIESDIKSDSIPFCVVATVGTTGTTSSDPVSAIAKLCKKYNIWLHVDAAYAGSAAVIPEMKYIIDGWNEADSIVLNPHKWFFTPIDLSVLYCKKPEILKRAFSIVPEYLKTDRKSEVNNLMDYGSQLGRRFRALKLWMIMRYFGEEGLVNRLREHIRIAREFGKWIDESPDFHALAVPFSTVCFRYFPKELKDKTTKLNEERIEAYLDEVNEALMNSVNATGEIFISHTRVKERFVLRLSVGNIKTNQEHVKQAWEILKEHGPRIDKSTRHKINLF